VRALGTPEPTEVGIQLSVAGVYRPPVLMGAVVLFGKLPRGAPPQTIISTPVHTAVWKVRKVGTLPPIDVDVQLSLFGL
jgi:hypothetical protein